MGFLSLHGSLIDTDTAQSTIKSAIQGLGIFLIAQFVVSQLFGNNNKVTNKSESFAVPAYDARPHESVEIPHYNPVPQKIAPIWPLNSTLDVSIYVAPSLVMPSLNSVDPGTLVLEEKGFGLGDWSENRQIDTTFAVPKEVQNNGTLWAHFYVALQGHVLDPSAKNYDVAKAYHFFRPLNHVLPKKKVAKTKKLLGGSDEKDDVEIDNPKPPGPGSYYHPNFTISFIPDSGTPVYPSMHPAIRQHVPLESTGARDSSGQHGWYYPIIYVNTFWQLKDHMTELNSSVTTLPLHVTLNNLNNWKFSLYASIDDGLKQNQKRATDGGPMPAGGDGSEFEEFKRVLIDTNVYLLSTTAIVSVLHMVFEGLAFKSDIVSISHPGFSRCSN